MLGICYGFQVMAYELGGKVDKAALGEYGKTSATMTTPPASSPTPPADPRQLADGMACTPERLAGELRALLDKGEIRTMPDGRLALSGDPDSLGRAN